LGTKKFYMVKVQEVQEVTYVFKCAEDVVICNDDVIKNGEVVDTIDCSDTEIQEVLSVIEMKPNSY